MRIPWTALLALLLAAAAAPARSSADEPAASHPTLALEDTVRSLPEPLPEVLIEAERASLDEILRRVAEGEARRDSLMRDAAYTLFFKVIGHDRPDDPPEKRTFLVEDVFRVYKKRPNLSRQIPLRHTSGVKKDGADESGASVELSIGPEMSESLISFAFHPGMRERFRFAIEERTLAGGHVIYRLGFAPRSRLDPLPEGRCWVDTNDFVILREEFWYRGRSPAPLFIESIDSCVLERTRIDGRFWVLSRVLARMKLTDPVRLAGRLAGEKVNRYYDVSVLQSDWIVNGDVPDSLFQGASARRDGVTVRAGVGGDGGEKARGGEQAR